MEERNSTIPGFEPIKHNIKRTIKLVEDIKNHPILKNKYRIIYNQSLVLLVACFESFMNDLVRDVVDTRPEIVSWPDKRLISFDPSVLRYSSPTIGSLVVKHLREKYNFQDLKSTLDFLSEYFKVDLSLEKDLKDRIIVYEALRHVIIHNSGKVDEKFIKQVRDTVFAIDYKIGEVVNINECQ